MGARDEAEGNKRRQEENGSDDEGETKISGKVCVPILSQNVFHVFL